jgi:GAF domain
MQNSAASPAADPRSLLEPLVPLESVVTTFELARRRSRPPDFATESTALLQLTEAMAQAPHDVLQSLAETALRLCHAGTAGISIIEEEAGRKVFRWRALAGELAKHLLGTTPREFSPCGTVVDRNATMLMTRLDQHYRYFADVQPRIMEALLVPFSLNGLPIGTVWVVHHDETAKFDAEDARLIADLGKFASAACRVRGMHPLGVNEVRDDECAEAADPLAMLKQVVEGLRQQLAHWKSCDSDRAIGAAAADLGRLVFLVDGLIERTRSGR